MSSNIKYFYLSLAIGAFIRLMGLDFQSLWLDEMYSVLYANTESFQELFSKSILTRSSEANPPLYYVFLYYWVKIFGESPVSVRLPSALAGILSICLIYQYAKTIFTEEIAVISSIIFSFSYASLYYSQEARAYSFLILFSILATFYWLKVVFDTNHKISDVTKYIIIVTLTAYTHYFGLLLVCIQLGYWSVYTLFYKKPKKNLTVVILVFILAYLPWAPYMFNTFFQHGGGKFWIPEPTFSLFFDYIDLLFKPRTMSLSLLVLAPLFFGFKDQLTNLVNIVKKNFTLESPIFALGFLTTAMLSIPFLISFHTPIFFPRNLMGIAPVLFVLVAMWISRSLINKKNVVSYVFLSCLICLFYFLPKYYSSPLKTQYREAVLYVIEESDEASVIIGAPLYGTSVEFYNYYLRYFDYDSNKVVGSLNGFTINDLENFSHELKRTNVNDLFILEAHSFRIEKNIFDAYKNISKNYDQMNYIGARVHHFTF